MTTSIDEAIERLEADLAALKRAREVLGGVAERWAPRAPKASTKPAAPPSPKTGRDRASVTASYAALVPRAASLDPKTCRAIKLRAEGKMPAAIAAAMRLKVDDVNAILLAGRRRLEGGRAAPAKEPARDVEGRRRERARAGLVVRGARRSGARAPRP